MNFPPGSPAGTPSYCSFVYDQTHNLTFSQWLVCAKAGNSAAAAEAGPFSLTGFLVGLAVIVLIWKLGRAIGRRIGSAG